MKKLLTNKKFQLPVTLFLIGIILMLAADMLYPAAEEDDGNNNSAAQTDIVKTDSSGTGTSPETLEKQVRQLIESISGVKSASVVITYENSGQFYTQKDTDTNSSKTNEKDNSGGEREITDESIDEETIYVEGSDGSKKPFIASEKYADVRGVAVVVKGTYDETIKEKIVRALEVLLSLPTHKIQVIW